MNVEVPSDQELMQCCCSGAEERVKILEEGEEWFGAVRGDRRPTRTVYTAVVCTGSKKNVQAGGVRYLCLLRLPAKYSL